MLKTKFSSIIICVYMLSCVVFQVRANVHLATSFNINQHIIIKLKNDIQRVKSQQFQNDLCTFAVGGSWGYITSLFWEAYRAKDNGLARVAAGLTGGHILMSLILWIKVIHESNYLKEELSFLNNELEHALASQQSLDEQEKLHTI